VISTPSAELLHPLPVLYQHEGNPLPEFKAIPAGELPQPYRNLLAHSGDMTSKLEEFHGDELVLRVLFREDSAGVYRREVLLCSGKTGRPVEYGAIEINLAAFDAGLRSEILDARLPLGGLLNRHRIRYRSEPRAFLRIAADPRLAELFALPAPSALYGRSNVLLDARGRTLAQIVEILPPASA
jgi:chorismate-pyruvate lyase